MVLLPKSQTTSDELAGREGVCTHSGVRVAARCKLVTEGTAGAQLSPS